MVCQPWVSASPPGSPLVPTSALPSASWADPFGLQLIQDTKSHSTLVKKGFWFSSCCFASFLMKSKRQLGTDKREECTEIDQRRRRRDKTKAVNTAGWSLPSFHNSFISEPNDAQALSAGLQLHFTFSGLFRWLNDAFPRNVTGVTKYGLFLVNVKQSSWENRGLFANYHLSVSEYQINI